MRRTLLTMLTLLWTLAAGAQNWDYIRTSGEYYWGQGHGRTEAEARQQALAQLTSMIATHVSNDFRWLSDQKTQDGSTSHQEQVLSCVRTYSQATLTNVEWWPQPLGAEPDVAQRCWMAKKELHHIFEERISKARSMVQVADEALAQRQLDYALQNYYWAYSLVRSLQYPQEAKTENGHVLVDWLPLKIASVLGGITFEVEGHDGDRVNLLATYQGQPVRSLLFKYSDGRATCDGAARDGHAMMEMVPGYRPKNYHLDVDYECRSLARGDAEVEAVMAVVSPRYFMQAAFTLPDTPAETTAKTDTAPKVPTDELPAASTKEGATVKEAIDRVSTAITARRYQDAESLFTTDGLDMWRRLVAYGRARLMGTPQLSAQPTTGGRTVVRGMQMSFSFSRGTKKTFVEDVAFTFNAEGKIEAVAFGIGRQATADILRRSSLGWGEDNCQMLVEFLESYKTAYCLERIDYLRSIFDDNATIIVGNVAWKPAGARSYNDNSRRITVDGQRIITYNRYDKQQYIEHLTRCFNRNEFINLRFTSGDVRWLDKFQDRKMFAIQLGQDYNSTTYADMGYLFLIVDLTDNTAPSIHVRTWQPNVVDMDKVYHEGYFYR